MDLFVYSSGPFFVWGGSSEPREPPLAMALCVYQCTVTNAVGLSVLLP